MKRRKKYKDKKKKVKNSRTVLVIDNVISVIANDTLPLSRLQYHWQCVIDNVSLSMCHCKCVNVSVQRGPWVMLRFLLCLKKIYINWFIKWLGFSKYSMLIFTQAPCNSMGLQTDFFSSFFLFFSFSSFPLPTFCFC